MRVCYARDWPYIVCYTSLTMDTVSTSTRSRIMRAVRSRGNKSTERKLRASMVGAGTKGWVMHEKTLPGKPDFVFMDKQVAVFVDGCFWHGCPICYRRPSSSQEYWDNKLSKNSNRDKRNTASLEEMGWRVLRIWEHELHDLRVVRSRIDSALADHLDRE